MVAQAVVFAGCGTSDAVSQEVASSEQNIDAHLTWNSLCRRQYYSLVQKGKGGPFGESTVSIYDSKFRTVYHELNKPINFERVRNKWQAVQDGFISLKVAPKSKYLKSYAELNEKLLENSDIFFVFYETNDCEFCEQNYQNYVTFKDAHPDLVSSLIAVEVELDKELDRCPV